MACDTRFESEVIQILNCRFIKVVEIEDKESVDLLRRTTDLDLGESEAIVLTNETKADLLLMDEAKGRNVAEQMGLKIMGTIGLLLASYQSGIITAEEIKNCIKVIRSSGRYIGEKYLQMLLKQINNDKHKRILN